ncbi:hypothetical protein ACET3Z_005033 [Daucus carota]
MKRKERGKNPTRLEVWNRTHTRVGSDPDHPVHTMPAAMAIAEKERKLAPEKDYTDPEELLEEEGGGAEAGGVPHILTRRSY